MNLIETLESRRLFAITVQQVGDWLNVDGSNGNDHITIEDSNGWLRVRDNGVSVSTNSGVTHVRVRAFAGNDKLFITSGQTQIQFLIDMGDGHDIVEPGNGNHFITGGNGADEVSYASFGISMYITNLNGGWTGYDASTGVTHEDMIGADVEALRGGSANDRIVGNNNANILKGGPGNDTMSALGGVDWLWGGPGNDSMLGGEGNDTLVGEQGNDTMIGGLGSDTFFAFDRRPDTIIGDNVFGVNVAGTFDRVYGDTIDLLTGHEWAELTPTIFLQF